MSGFIPPLHFLGGMWIAIALLPQEKKNKQQQTTKQTKIDCSHVLFQKMKECECILSVYSLYNINRVFR